MTKSVVISAFLPQLPSAHAYQQAQGAGSTLAVAIKRAVDNLLARPHVRGRRLETLKINVAVIGETS